MQWMPRIEARIVGLLLAGMLVCAGTPAAKGASGEASAIPAVDEARLNTVRIFADRVLQYGRDRYREKPTPLFVDGLNVDTLEPVRWVYKGERWIPSNLASQQNLFRTLVGLSNLTGDPRYRKAAEEAIAYHFEHLRSPCGLLPWGGHRWVDLATGNFVGEGGRPHEFKLNLPFYELMWEVNPSATEQFIKAFWNAHILDWGKLDMNRHGAYGKPMGALWDNTFEDPEPFFEGDGLTFLNAGTDLIYAGVLLYKFTGDQGALTWAKRLAYQYVKARHPKTGLGVVQYSKPVRRQQPPATGPLPEGSNYGDRAENQFGAEFGEVAREGYMIRSPGTLYEGNAIAQLQLAELLGKEGSDFLKWTVDGLRAYARYGYDPKTNRTRPLWADGTDLTGYVIKRDGYYGKAGTVFRASTASLKLFWSYALAHRLSGDRVLWETARSIARGHGLGDLGSAPGRDVRVNLDTQNAHPMALFGLLEVWRMADVPAYRALARRIADNMVRQRFHRGFFLPSADRVNANFDTLEPLAILSLEAMLRGTPEAVPRYTGGQGFIHGPHDGLGRTYDSTAIWSVRRKR
ncbi:MAG TPA: pectate lyase [Armatimonadota bacterium]|jgi:pectate lyase|nr:pectate lyase [Armatimonadota bacterium]HOM80533.1 pectate lyase [Armatimonadota bacterium]HPO71422.1 pectate lyase [Armatimonadota bacterium]HPT96896.1 pectate lyase [Armatimonadota bacterium]